MRAFSGVGWDNFGGAQAGIHRAGIPKPLAQTGAARRVRVRMFCVYPSVPALRQDVDILISFHVLRVSSSHERRSRSANATLNG